MTMDMVLPIQQNNTKNPIAIFWEKCGHILLDPTRFFRYDLNGLSWSESLTFGIVSAWVASFISFLWGTLNSFVLVAFFDHWVQQLLSTEEGFSLMGTSSKSFLWAC